MANRTAMVYGADGDPQALQQEDALVDGSGQPFLTPATGLTPSTGLTPATGVASLAADGQTEVHGDIVLEGIQGISLVQVGSRIKIGLSSGGGVPVGGYLYTYKRAIVIGNNGSTLTNAAVYLPLDSTTFDFAHALANGWDLQFQTTSGTLLSYYVQLWDAVAEKAIVWVRVPSLPGGGNTVIWMYYGCANAVTSSSASAVFSGFTPISPVLAAWEFYIQDNVASGAAVPDASGQGYGGILSGGATIVAAGRLGLSAIQIPAPTPMVLTTSLAPGPTWSFGLWAQTFHLNGAAYLVSADAQTYVYSWDYGNTIRFQRTGAEGVVLSDIPSDTSWHHLAGVFSGGNATFYMDGVQGATVGGAFSNIGSVGAKSGMTVSPVLDSLHLYGVALDSSQVAALANRNARAVLSGGYEWPVTIPSLQVEVGTEQAA